LINHTTHHPKHEENSMITIARAWGIALSLAVLLACVSFDATAQGVTTAGINGMTIAKTNGEAIPGVNIVATHVPSGTKYGTSSRADGRYTLPNLRVGGPYTVTASAVGYRPETRTDIYLSLSENLDLTFTMTEEAVQAAEVVVVGEQTSVFNASHTGASTNVSQQQIEMLPTLSRNFQDYYKVSPYITGDKGNALGRNSKYNNIQLDGTNFNDIFGLGSTGAPAGQSSVTPISLDAIEEFQLVVSPYDVRQSGFTGAGINAISRSGTNEYKGSAFYYGRNEDFAGKSPDALKSKLAGFTDWQAGARIGGPIIENQLFFFANGEVTRFKQPFTRTFGNSAISTNAYTANADSLQMLSDYLKAKYGYDPGGFATIGSNRESDKLFFRFDYNLSENHKVSAHWSYLRSSEDNSPSRGRGTTDIYFDNGKYKLDNTTNSVALLFNSIFGNTASNEFTLGYVDQKDQPIYYGSAFPQLIIQTYPSPGSTDTRNQNLLLGSEEFRHYNLLVQKYFEITDNFTLYLQEHTITFGGRVDLMSFRNLFIPDGFGTYAYSSIGYFLSNRNNPALDPPTPNGAPGFGPYSFRYSATSNPEQEANWKANQFGLYAEDEWAVCPSVKLIGGLRIDIPTYPEHPNHNAGIETYFGYKNDDPPKTSLAFSPRIGFNWSVDEERNTQVRGGIGIFYGRFPYVWVSNQYSNTGVDFYTVTSAPPSFIADPYNQPKAATGLPTAEVDLTDPNFKAPSVIRWSLAVDHKLPYDLTATVEGIFSVTQNDVYYQNINLKPRQSSLGGDGRPVFGVWNIAGTGFVSNSQWIRAEFSPGVLLVRNTDLGSNSNITVQVQRNSAEPLNGSVAYTWGIAKDINSGNSTTASSGWRFNPTPGDPNNPQLTYSEWDRRHRVLVDVTYRQDWGSGFVTNIGVFYTAQSGRPFSYLISGDVNGDGRSDNDLAYIPKDANDILLANSAGVALPRTDAAYSQLMAFIDADPYLKENKGKISERSGPREPWSHSVDMRISQIIPTIGTQNFEITLDILNVLNLINSDWGWIRNTGTNQTVNLYTFKGLEATAGPDQGKPKYLWSGLKVTDGKADPFQPDNILSRWQMQLGVRYTF
jgi:hypothetical protein